MRLSYSLARQPYFSLSRGCDTLPLLELTPGGTDYCSGWAIKVKLCDRCRKHRVPFNLVYRCPLPVLSHRSIALIVVSATLVGAWPNANVMWAIAIVDAVGFVLICFPDTIDDLTFGTFTRGARIDAHTPPWMIAGIGWLLIFLMAALLVWRTRI